MLLGCGFRYCCPCHAKYCNTAYMCCITFFQNVHMDIFLNKYLLSGGERIQHSSHISSNKWNTWGILLLPPTYLQPDTAALELFIWVCANLRVGSQLRHGNRLLLIIENIFFFFSSLLRHSFLCHRWSCGSKGMWRWCTVVIWSLNLWSWFITIWSCKCSNKTYWEVL